MLPRKPVESRLVRKYEVITPDGRVHRFPRPSWLSRLADRLSPYADIAALSAAILVLVTIAGFAAEALDRAALDACNDQLMRRTGLS